MSVDGTLEVTVEDDAVRFALTVENVAEKPVELTFGSSKAADFAVLRDDEEVWRWSEGRMFTQAIETETVGPGEKLTLEQAWPDPEPGEYVAVATLESDPGLEVSTPFSV